MPEFCNRNTKALVFYEKGKTFTILTLNGTVPILEVGILKPCILSMITIDSLLDLVKSETYQKQVISPVALSENDNEG